MDPQTTDGRPPPLPPLRPCPLGAATLILLGLVLLVPNAAWVGAVVVGWLQDRVGWRMVAVLSLPVALTFLALSLIYTGASRLQVSAS